MSTAMRVEVDGSVGVKTAGEKVKQGGVGSLGLTPITQASQDGAKAATDANGRGNDLGGATGNDLHIKIAMRPRDGLRISDVTSVEVSRAITAAAQVDAIAAREDVICLNHQQNIVVVSTSKREHADRYAMVDAYESAPHGTVKGVIRDIPLEDTAQEIQDLVQENRMGRTRSVVIAFEGHKVPNYVQYGNLLIECTLHRKQIDACYACGRVGHRMDVRPNPQDKICRGCGIANPEEDHKCEPRRDSKRLTSSVGGARRRAEEDNEDRNQGKGGSKERPQRSTSSQRGQSQTPARSSNGGGHQSRSRSMSRSGDGGGNRRGVRASRGSSGRSRSRTKFLSHLSDDEGQPPRKRWAGPTGFPLLGLAKPNCRPSPPPNLLAQELVRNRIAIK
ncbi:hypothetical protein HPB52_010745 [Rhipicephalus sanguineus]|uniref:Uncharacterized protein n=1 Tax=Rhipicephalus sanguineus TaxID=34632 RepID=A0A9D4PCA4_RHISA|nr:hypothetical protein HPB52_010745 [Rhipicephalus sanguineus]